MDLDHYRALSAAWLRVRDDDAIRVAVVTGAGERSFTTGADLKSVIGRRRISRNSGKRNRTRCSIAGLRSGSRSLRRSTAIAWAAG